MKKEYIFLTGATGLVGSNILRQLLRDGQRVALLVRPFQKISAEKRIDHLLSYWKREYDESFDRPKVVVGDLTDTQWYDEYLDWFGNSCETMIHCAASLQFYGNKSGDPWRSNLEGTQKIIDLCRRAEIGKMHYISTAYIGGSSKVFYENEADKGQCLRNDYEQSKFEAENMVRNADCFNSLTIYRPSIIVGDSNTAFTPTFHGFYAVLKMAHTLVRRLSFGSTSGRNMLGPLGMDGSENKNFVPIDWVVAVFTHIFKHPEYHGKTYHLASPHPLKLNQFVDAVQDAVETYSTLAEDDDPNRADEEWFLRNCSDSIQQVYNAYLQDDPVFDSRNTQEAAPHLPCPVMDHDLMMFLARYAIQSKFGKKTRKARLATA